MNARYKCAVVALAAAILSPLCRAQCPGPPYNLPTRIFGAVQPHPTAVRALVNPLTAAAPSAALTMVALGDSVIWGNGLTDNEKILGLAAQQLADKTQRSVRLVSYAHSAANLLLHPPTAGPPSGATGYVPFIPTDNVPLGDLNSPYPTTSEQADCAAAAYPDAELVVLNGCINEVDPEDVSLPPIFNSTSPQVIESRAYLSCSVPMRDTLTKVKKQFPNATIIVLNYYQMVSADSTSFGNGSPDVSSQKQLKRVAKERQKVNKVDEPPPPDWVITWAQNSTAFLNTSEACFRWAIGADESEALVNAGTAADPICAAPSTAPSPPSPSALHAGARVYLATVRNRPEFAYGARKTHLWSLPIQFLFWTIHADDTYSARKRLCDSHYPELDQLSAREVCTINSIAHPNREGAKAFACSIVLDPALKCDPSQPGILDLAWAQP